MSNFNLNDNRWRFRFEGQTPQNLQLTQDSIEGILSRLNSTDGVVIDGQTVADVVIEAFLANENITNDQLVEIVTLTEQDINGSFTAEERANEESVREKFDDYDSRSGHIFAVDLFHILTGLDKDFISQNLSGLGFTGKTGPHVIHADFSQPLLLGTALHDVTSYFDDILGIDIKSFNESLFGTASLEGSAVIMAGMAFYEDHFSLELQNYQMSRG